LPTSNRLKIDTILPPLTVETLVNGGAGLARYEGRVVFIPHSAVGDVVKCRVTKTKKNFLVAEIIEILKSAPKRRHPECPVSGDCGGCQWQHLPYQDQLYWKERLFRESLTRSGEISSTNILPLVPATDAWHYRSRVQIKCRNTKTGFVTGFFRPQSHFVVAVEQCPVIAPELNTLLNRLRQLINRTSYANDVPQIDLAIDDVDHCLAVLHYSGNNQASFADLIATESGSADLLVKTTIDHQLLQIRGKGELQITVDQPKLKLKYAAGGFAQINLQQNRELVNTVLQLADLVGDELVLDLYCGMGNFSLPLARRARKVIGVEESRLSITMAKRNQRLNRVENITFYERVAEKAVTYFGQRYRIDLLLLDPPRAGAVDTMKELLKNPVNRVIYVSCDPQTLVRDLKLLINGGYEMVSSQPFDMFPQTHHCESVTLLRFHS